VGAEERWYKYGEPDLLRMIVIILAVALGVTAFAIIAAHILLLQAKHIDLGYGEFIIQSSLLYAEYFLNFPLLLGGPIIISMRTFDIANWWARQKAARSPYQDTLLTLQVLTHNSVKGLLTGIFWVSGWGSALLYGVSSNVTFWCSFIVVTVTSSILFMVVIYMHYRMHTEAFMHSVAAIRSIVIPYAICIVIVAFAETFLLYIFGYRQTNITSELLQMSGLSVSDLDFEFYNDFVMASKLFTVPIGQLPLHGQAEGLLYGAFIVIAVIWLVPALLRRDFLKEFNFLLSMILIVLGEVINDWTKDNHIETLKFIFSHLSPQAIGLILAVFFNVIADFIQSILLSIWQKAKSRNNIHNRTPTMDKP
jgi:hypothetical protein